MNKTHAIIALIFIILFGLLYISIRLDFPKAISEVINPEENKENQNIPNPQSEQYSPPDSEIPSTQNPSPNTKGGGSEGGGGTTEGNTPSTSSGCELRTISYGLKNFEKSSTCLAYQDTTCIEQIMNCSVSVKNLDYETSGEFEIIFKYSFENTQQIYSTNAQTKNVLSQETQRFSDSLAISGSEASQKITCSFEVGSAPKKEVCF